MNEKDKKLVKSIMKNEVKILRIIKELMKYSNWREMLKYLYDKKIIGKKFLKLYKKFNEDIDKLVKYISDNLNKEN